MAVEIERKFLVNNNSFLETYSKHSKISQTYIFIEDNRVLRIRKIDDECIFSLKIGLNQIKRLEFEYSIPKSDADMIISSSKYNLIEKDRYYVKHHDGKIWEVDVFKGLNEGLIIAEIELDNESDKFSKPSWIGEEVSDVDKYLNYNLSINPYHEWI